jgi:enamine deaminase RidA (YjgF/YER057c/UK114 family)
MERQSINPWQWQDQFGFSQAIEVKAAQCTLYCSGQTSIDAQGHTAHPDDMSAQIGKAMDNLEEVLSRAEYRLSDIVRLTVYTTDVDRVFASYGGLVKRLAQAGAKPTMAVLGVTRLAFPELMVEIEATAAK